MTRRACAKMRFFRDGAKTSLRRGSALQKIMDRSGEAERVGRWMPNKKLVLFGHPKAGTSRDHLPFVEDLKPLTFSQELLILTIQPIRFSANSSALFPSSSTLGLVDVHTARLDLLVYSANDRAVSLHESSSHSKLELRSALQFPSKSE